MKHNELVTDEVFAAVQQDIEAVDLLKSARITLTPASQAVIDADRADELAALGVEGPKGPRAESVSRQMPKDSYDLWVIKMREYMERRIMDNGSGTDHPFKGMFLIFRGSLTEVYIVDNFIISPTPEPEGRL